MNQSLLKQAARAIQMGSFVHDGYQPHPSIPKDVGCAGAERRPYYYYGKCIDCPIPKCLEDGGGFKSAQLSIKRNIVKKRREAMWNYMLVNGKDIAATAKQFHVSTRTVYLMLEKRLYHE